MSANVFDFEKAWLHKFSRNIIKYTNHPTEQIVMKDSEKLSSNSDNTEIIKWTEEAINRLESNVDSDKCKNILLACSCEYPKSDLIDAKELYKTTKDIKKVHQLLQLKFEDFLKEILHLDQKTITFIKENYWGLAGRLINSHSIVATKIPKSGNLTEYFKETDPQRKRFLYCHCPRIRNVLENNEKISSTYCYCGAGFYKKLWEEITGKVVEISVDKSVMNGDDVCSFSIYIK